MPKIFKFSPLPHPILIFTLFSFLYIYPSQPGTGPNEATEVTEHLEDKRQGSFIPPLCAFKKISGEVIIIFFFYLLPFFFRDLILTNAFSQVFEIIYCNWCKD